MKKRVLFDVIIFIIFIIAFIACFIHFIIEEENVDIFLLVAIYIVEICMLTIININFSKYTKEFPKNAIYLDNLIEEPDLNDNLTIKVEKENDLLKGNYLIYINGRKYQIDLNGYFFKKDYIIALISRNFRYLVISNKHALIHLFDKTIDLSKINSDFNCEIVFSNEKNTDNKRICVVKNSKNHLNYIQRKINKSNFYAYFLMPILINKYLKGNICSINEKIYHEGKLDV